jgi:hypothetical protein
MSQKMITVQLEEGAAGRLATLCKRTIIERVMPFAADKAEAIRMMTALNVLGAALEERGFSPR